MWHLEEIVRRNKTIADKFLEQTERSTEHTQLITNRESETEGEMQDNCQEATTC
jgi:hypothetical protein